MKIQYPKTRKLRHREDMIYLRSHNKWEADLRLNLRHMAEDLLYYTACLLHCSAWKVVINQCYYLCTTYLSFPNISKVLKKYLPLSFQTEWCSFDFQAKPDSGSGFILLRKMENGNLQLHQWALIRAYLLLWMLFGVPPFMSYFYSLICNKLQLKLNALLCLHRYTI